MARKRRRNTAASKLRVALEALKGSKTNSRLLSEHDIHPNLVRPGKRQLLEDGPSVFAASGEHKKWKQEAQAADLCEQIERLKIELEWLKVELAGSISENRREDDSRHAVPGIRRQCELLGPNRALFYYRAAPESAQDLLWMRLIAADRQSPVSSQRIRLEAPYFTRSVVQTFGPTTGVRQPAKNL